MTRADPETMIAALRKTAKWFHGRGDIENATSFAFEMTAAAMDVPKTKAAPLDLGHAITCHLFDGGDECTCGYRKPEATTIERASQVESAACNDCGEPMERAWACTDHGCGGMTPKIVEASSPTGARGEDGAGDRAGSATGNEAGAAASASVLSAPQSEPAPSHSIPAGGLEPQQNYSIVVHYNDDGEFGAVTGWLYRTGGEPCVVTGKPVYVWRSLSDLTGKYIRDIDQSGFVPVPKGHPQQPTPEAEPSLPKGEAVEHWKALLKTDKFEAHAFVWEAGDALLALIGAQQGEIERLSARLARQEGASNELAERELVAIRRATALKARLESAERVVEAAREYFRCNPGPKGIAGEELREATRAIPPLPTGQQE